MKKAALIMVLIAGIMVVASACGSSQPTTTAPDNQDGGPPRVEVSRNGFNNTATGFRLEVKSGQEVEITFVYGDSDFPENNPHVMGIPDLDILTEPLDEDNPEITVRFTAGEPGELIFWCTNVECVGHANLMDGTIVIVE